MSPFDVQSIVYICIGIDTEIGINPVLESISLISAVATISSDLIC